MDDAIACDPRRNSPPVAAMIGDNQKQYFVLVEQTVLCEESSIQLAIFVMFACYYVFNLDYPKKAQSLFLFFQYYILGYPDSLIRPSTYLAVVSDIKTHLS